MYPSLGLGHMKIILLCRSRAIPKFQLGRRSIWDSLHGILVVRTVGWHRVELVPVHGKVWRHQFRWISTPCLSMQGCGQSVVFIKCLGVWRAVRSRYIKSPKWHSMSASFQHPFSSFSSFSTAPSYRTCSESANLPNPILDFFIRICFTSAFCRTIRLRVRYPSASHWRSLIFSSFRLTSQIDFFRRSRVHGTFTGREPREPRCGCCGNQLRRSTMSSFQ